MAGEKKWTVYGIAIAALFWLAWLAFCGIALVTERPYGVAGMWVIIGFSLFLGWNYLLAVCIRRRLVIGLVALVVAAGFGCFYLMAISGVRSTPGYIVCRNEMRGMPQLAINLRWVNVSEDAIIQASKSGDYRCYMRRKPDAKGRLTYHLCVELPQEGAAERFGVISHMLLPEAAEKIEIWYSYEFWKENVDAALFVEKHGRPYCQDYTVLVFYRPSDNGMEERFPLSAAGFAACVDGAADADALYTAIKTTSEAETAAYERYMAICEYSRFGSAGATYFFMLLIMVRMVWRGRTYQPQA